MEKRESCRAIIFNKNQLALLYREKENRVYYVFPGGGKNENETLNECVKREIFEELGIDILPKKEIYLYENEATKQHFILCEWISGEFGSGNGEEFQADQKRGVYIPIFVEIEDIKSLPIMPPEVAEQLIIDLKLYGKNLGDETKFIYEKY